MCIFALLRAHRYHNAGKADWLIKPLDDRDSTYIRRTVKAGCRRLKKSQSRVTELIGNHKFCDTNPLPTIKHSFYSSRSKIKNITDSVKKQVRHSKFDQGNLLAYSEKWRTNSSLYFVPMYVDIKKCFFCSILSL